MKIVTSPEIHVHDSFLDRKDLIKKVIYLDNNLVDVHLEHPVLGDVVEIFEHNKKKNLLTLKSVVLHEMADYEEVEIAQDYYNNFCLDGHETYLFYTHPEVGFYLNSRNS